MNKRLLCSRLVFVTGLLLTPISNVVARIGPILDYRTQFDKSDLVVIARPTAATNDANEHSVFQGIASTDGQGKTQPVEAIGVETPFQISLVLKGGLNGRSFTLHHYREVPSSGGTINGPVLVSFTNPSGDSQPHSYLMFLKREPDGRFAPTGGQVDPAMYAIFPLPFGAQ